MKKSNPSNLFLILSPITFGILFSILMIFLGVISTQKARDHYRSKKLMRSIQQIGRIRLGPGGLVNSPEPPAAAPVKRKNWFTEYELRYPLMVLPLFIVGFSLVRLLFGSLPERNPFSVSDSMRRSLLAMVCLLLLSPAFLILYLWSLRVGLIG
jgi:hypothetical protein